jgi:hypothetical protein
MREYQYEELFVDTYDAHEEFDALAVYFDACLTFSFEAIWRNEDGSGYEEQVTVINWFGSTWPLGDDWP